MSMQRPARNLSPIVHHYWLMRSVPDSEHPVLADGNVDAVFEIGRDTGVRLHGPATRRAECALRPGYHYFGICFRPGQARHFLSDSVKTITDGSTAIPELVSVRADTLADAIADGDPFRQIDAALERWLARHPPPFDVVDRAVEAIDRSNGGIRIERLALRLGIGRRHLERRFLDRVGISPKTYAGIRRWRYAMGMLRTQPDISLSWLALRAGYADQSHMTRDFRRKAGRPPRVAAEVAFVQDTAPLPR